MNNKAMEIGFNWSDPDQMMLGVMTSYIDQEDEHFMSVTFGFFIFEVVVFFNL